MHSLLRASALAALLLLAPSALAQDLAPHVYPNPISTDRAVTVEVADAESATVEVVDVLGRVISTDASLAAGTYLVRVRYADGRVTSSTSITVATPGAVEFLLAEASAPAALAPAPASPDEAVVANKGLLCSSGDAVFGGMYHTALTGSLRIRSDLTPKSMRAQPAAGSNTVDFLTCFNAVQGYAFRYIAGGDAGNRPLRVLSPANVGNTRAAFVADYTVDGGGAQQALYGTYETTIDNGTATVPAVGVGFDADYVDTATRQNPTSRANRGGGYQILVFDGDALVYEGIASETTPLYVTPTGAATRINLLRSLLLSSAVEGFSIDGSIKPGDLSAVFTFESGDGANVNVHVDEGAPVAQGTTIHVTPSLTYTDPFTFTVSQVRTYATGVNRFGVRALQFAIGSTADAQWVRPQGEYTEPHLFGVIDPVEPYVLVDSDGPVDDYGTQWGREPAPLQEIGSQEISVAHDFGGPIGPTKGGGPVGGYVIDEPGEFYRSTSLVRNETDGQGESITVLLEHAGSNRTEVTVTNANGTFTEYDLEFFREGGGGFYTTYPVGATNSFTTGALTFLFTGAVDDEFPEYFNGFQVMLGDGSFGVLFVYPRWDTPEADIDIRSYAVETDSPHEITYMDEDSDEAPTRLSTKAPSRWVRGER